MKNFQTLDTISPQGKVVLLRADLNVPMQDGAISDMMRITRLLPTISELSDKGAKVVILSHFGRPRGKDAALSLEPVGQALSLALGRAVRFVPDCIGEAPQAAIREMNAGDIILLENVRFYPEEEKNDREFAAKIAELGDIYVNDAFSAAHRAHATTEGLAHFLPAYAGRLMEQELNMLEKTLGTPVRPVLAIVGGAKISTKLDLLNHLVTKIDVLVLGGGMANTFLHALGHPMGKSLCEREMDEQALKILEIAKDNHCRVILPVDGVIAKEFKAGTETEIRGADNIPSDGMMLDIGKGSVAVIADAIRSVKTILWNGPMGAFEIHPFDAGTTALAKIVATHVQQGDLICVAGGGDTVSALVQAEFMDKMTYVSTAGGAFLEWMEGKELPGVKALQDSKA